MRVCVAAGVVGCLHTSGGYGEDAQLSCQYITAVRVVYACMHGLERRCVRVPFICIHTVFIILNRSSKDMIDDWVNYVLYARGCTFLLALASYEGVGRQPYLKLARVAVVVAWTQIDRARPAQPVPYMMLGWRHVDVDVPRVNVSISIR
jgi:hypothetical protein